MSQEQRGGGVQRSLERRVILGGEGHPVLVAFGEQMQQSIDTLREMKRELLETGHLGQGRERGLPLLMAYLEVPRSMVCNLGHVHELSDPEILGVCEKKLEERLLRFHKEVGARRVSIG